MDAAHTAEAGGSFIPPVDTKDDLRLHFLKVAKARAPEDVAEASIAIAERVQGLPAFGSAQVVALYWALPSEPDTTSLIDVSAALGKRVLLPMFGHEAPQLGEFAGWDRLVPGPLGLKQPQGPPVEAGQVDLFVVPGLAFDRDGFRLGRGKGYYDRLLARRSPRAFLCGLCLDDMIVARLPRQAHDVPMACLVSPGATANPRGPMGYPLD
jgi:5-formyltetrahydrofolate cyclo-ligase